MLKKILQDEYYNKGPLFLEYLKEKGCSRQLIHKYIHNGWLQKIAQGVYSKPDLFFTPVDIISAIQKQLKVQVFLGATSALSSQNINFNLRQESNVQAFVPVTYRPTHWLRSVKGLFWFKASLFTHNQGLHLYNGILMSTPERAILEAISLIPKHMEYEEAYHLLELMPALRVSLLQELLQECKSIKTKRLFLYMAELIAHNWYPSIELTHINLGSGDRQVVKNGIYNKKYKLIVPEIS